MTTLKFTLLNKNFLRIGGADKLNLLQGLITNDMAKLTPNHPLYTALLSAQGRYLFDMIIYLSGDDYLIEIDPDRREDLKKKLSLYKLRSDVTLREEDNLKVYALFDALKNTLPSTQDHAVYLDPRLPDLGWRLLSTQDAQEWLESDGVHEASLDLYDLHRLILGIPDGAKDMPVEKAIPLECGLDELHAISWTKGCYLGQELTSRTKYTGIVRKRLLMVELIKGTFPEPNAQILWENQMIGTMRSHQGTHGLALIRLEHIEKHNSGWILKNPDYTLKITVPFWASTP